MSRVQLDPCPHCEGRAESLLDESTDPFISAFYICCTVCGARSGSWYTVRMAAEAWNRRDSMRRAEELLKKASNELIASSSFALALSEKYNARTDEVIALKADIARMGQSDLSKKQIDNPSGLPQSGRDDAPDGTDPS